MRINLGKRALSLLLILCLVLALVPTALASGTEGVQTEINSTTVWRYLDDGTDPAGDPSAEGYHRTSWTVETFDDSAWATGSGSFGAKNGKIADLGGGCTPTVLLNQYKKDGTDVEAYFFRTTVYVANASAVTAILGSVNYDDSATIYINGTRIAGFDDGSFTANLQYGGSSNSAPKTGEIAVTNAALLDALKTGENVVAVEVHQCSSGSSDIYFEMPSLTFSTAPVEAEEIPAQSSISLSMGADESQMNFTWYSPANEGTLYLAKQSELVNGALPASAAAIPATVAVAANKPDYCSNKVTVTGLEAGTAYAYQLENGGVWSDVMTFTTAGSGAFSFAYVADPQIGAGSSVVSDTEGWAKTLSILDTNGVFSDAAFLLSAGDQVNTSSSEEEYDGYLEHDELTSLPVATVIGNHDSSSSAYSEHFNVPNESSLYGTTSAGGDYYFVYNHVLFLILNSNDTSAAEHKQFMEDAIEATADQDITWKIVSFHHSVYTVASHSSDSYITSETGFKNTMVPILDELGIDVVLQGHDHVYCRTYMMDVFTPVTESDKYSYGNGTDEAPTAVTDPDGILYVTANSGSGSKTYDIVNAEFPFSAVQNQEHIPNVSKISVSDTAFTITTYRTTDMTVVDTFTIYHTASSNTPAEPSYTVSFVSDGHATVDVYYTQDYTNPDETTVTTAYARDSKTGEIDVSGDGQVNFKVNVEDGYEIASVTADANYKNLKDASETGVEGIYRLTKITGDVTVTIATTEGTGSGTDEPAYTPVEAAGTRVTGCYDETGSLQLELAGRYNSGAMNEDGGSLEIVEYNPVNGYAYAVSGVKGKLIAVDLNGSLDGDTVVELSGTEYDVKSLVDGFAYGDLTSVAVSPDGSKLAVAIQAEDYAAPGVVALFACNAGGSLTLLSTAAVGVQPDMVTFANNSTILSADEGEPREGTSGTDPKGSVSIVTIGADNNLTANIVYFDTFDAQRDALTAAGVLIQKDTQPSTDFEPEYIAVSGNTAYVSLQEANAIAVLDLTSGTFTAVYPLGFQDYSVTAVDLQKNDTIELATYDNVYGIKMPDGIAATTIGGKTYLLTANEGDSRADWDGLDNEVESKTSPTGNVTLDAKVVWFDANLWDGLDSSKAYVFGGRSFSIYEVTKTGLNLVFDSGSGFEEITAAQLPDYFNTSNDKTSVDNRSGKKGPEPESVVTGVVNGRTYAFIALERIGGVMVYDVTNPAKAEFVNYINSREFETAIQGDVSPEGLCFVSAADSKTGQPLLLTACEVSGTLAVYELTGTQEKEEPQKPSISTGSSSSTGTANTPSTGFVDVKSSAYYYDAVQWAVDAGITTGTTAGTFSPADACTRAQAVTFLWRAVGSPEPVNAVNPFTDVSKTAYYYKAVLWAVELGITNGTSAAAFSPDAACTRAQIVTFLWRLEGAKAGHAANPFTDVANDAYYADAVLWAVSEGVTTGTSATTFSPDATCTRAQIVTFLYRDLAEAE